MHIHDASRIAAHSAALACSGSACSHMRDPSTHLLASPVLFTISPLPVQRTVVRFCARLSCVEVLAKLTSCVDTAKECAQLDFATLAARDAFSLLSVAAELERVAGALKGLTAHRVEVTDAHLSVGGGDRDAVALVARICKEDRDVATSILTVGRQVSELHAVEQACRKGDLNSHQVAPVVRGATTDPSRQEEILGSAERGTTRELNALARSIEARISPVVENARSSNVGAASRSTAMAPSRSSASFFQKKEHSSKPSSDPTSDPTATRSSDKDNETRSGSTHPNGTRTPSSASSNKLQAGPLRTSSSNDLAWWHRTAAVRR
jgi:hypothetical protein